MLIDSKTSTATGADIETVNTTLSAVRERIGRLAKEAEELEAQVRRARGTGDVTEQAKVAKTAPEPVVLPIAKRIETALRANVLTLPELAKEIGESTTKTASALKPLRKNLGNIGTAALARWLWRIGPQATTVELTDTIRRLIMDQPLTTAELVAVTGVRVSRVSGALVAIQRSGATVYNLGTQHRHRWFVVPENVLDARLAPKVTEPEAESDRRK